MCGYELPWRFKDDLRPSPIQPHTPSSWMTRGEERPVLHEARIASVNRRPAPRMASALLTDVAMVHFTPSNNLAGETRSVNRCEDVLSPRCRVHRTLETLRLSPDQPLSRFSYFTIVQRFPPAAAHAPYFSNTRWLSLLVTPAMP